MSAAGAERPGAVAGEDEAGDFRIVFVATDDGEDLVVHLVVQRIHGFGPAQGDDFHAVDVVDQDVAQEALIGIEGALGHGHAGALLAQAHQRRAAGRARPGCASGRAGRS